jgi:CheY-like chemotaxis protein
LPEVTYPSRAKDTSRRITGYVGRRISVLIVDDNLDHSAPLSQMLSSIGFNVSNENGGAGCLKMARTDHPDLIILDVSMPGMNGWEVAAALRESVSPLSRIIMLSGNAYEIDSHRETARHYDAVHIKPFLLDSLLQTIGDLLDVDWTTELERGDSAFVETESLVTMTASIAREFPSVQDLEDLKQLGEIGYVRGIREKLADLASRPQDYSWLVEQLDVMLQNLNFPRYLDTLSELIAEASKR